MTDDRTDQRAALLPEERAAGSDDPRAQAAAILADSDRREECPEPVERRRSEQSATSGEPLPSGPATTGDMLPDLSTVGESPVVPDSPGNVVSPGEATR